MRSAVGITYYDVERRVPASLLLITSELGIANTVVRQILGIPEPLTDRPS